MDSGVHSMFEKIREGRSITEEEEPPEQEMKQIANEFVDVLRRVTGKSLDSITQDMPDFVEFWFNFNDQELQIGGHSIRGDEKAMTDARNAFGDNIDEIEDTIFRELSGNMIDTAQIGDNRNPVSIDFDWDFTEYTVSGEPGSWEIFY